MNFTINPLALVKLLPLKQKRKVNKVLRVVGMVATPKPRTRKPAAKKAKPVAVEAPTSTSV